MQRKNTRRLDRRDWIFRRAWGKSRAPTNNQPTVCRCLSSSSRVSYIDNADKPARLPRCVPAFVIQSHLFCFWRNKYVVCNLFPRYSFLPPETFVPVG